MVKRKIGKVPKIPKYYIHCCGSHDTAAEVFSSIKNVFSIIFLCTYYRGSHSGFSVKRLFCDIHRKTPVLESLVNKVYFEEHLQMAGSVDPSQMKMTFHFFSKSGVLRKTSLTL